MWRVAVFLLTAAAAQKNDSLIFYTNCDDMPTDTQCKVVDKEDFESDFYKNLASMAFPAAIETKECDYLVSKKDITHAIKWNKNGSWVYGVKFSMVATECTRNSTSADAPCPANDETVVQYCYAEFRATANGTDGRETTEFLQRECSPPEDSSVCRYKVEKITEKVQTEEDEKSPKERKGMDPRPGSGRREESFKGRSHYGVGNHRSDD